MSRSAFDFNLSQLKKKLDRPTALHAKAAELMAVVKANAYGHQVDQIVPRLLRSGCKYFCVHSLEEAMEVRKLSARSKILVLGGTLHWTRSSLKKAEEFKLQIGVNDLVSLKFFLKQQSIPIHLKLDTGMNRLGIKPEHWSEALFMLQQSGRKLEGLYTHFASFYGASFRRQVMLFEEAVRWFKSENIHPKWIHCENSAAIFNKEKLKKGVLSEYCNMARPGISMYGYLPANFSTNYRLKPVLQLTAEIGLVKSIEKAEGISYDHLYKAKQAHRYGVVSLGYADGLSKAYAPHLRPQWLSSSGRSKGSLEICGSICMDMVMVRAKKGQLLAGDQVVFWGNKSKQLIAQSLADPYELNLRISKRIPRVWVD